MNGHRQAAVALYGLAPGDQDRILADLPVDDQRILRNYLAELAALGFDKAVIMAEAAEPVPFAPVAAPLDPATRLRDASAADVAAAIAHEPALLIAQVLSLENWPWAADLRDMLPPQKSRAVRDALERGIGAAPARDRFLLAAVVAALRHLPAIASSAAPRGIPSGLRRLLPWNR